MNFKHLWWLLPILIMALLTPFLTVWDMEIETFFYEEQFKPNAFYQFMYDFSIYPAQVVAILAFFALVGSYISPKWKKWRKPAMVLVLTMVVGAGFIVHTLLKDNWGRPRPKQLIEFGGKQIFRPYYSPNFNNHIEPSKSFPCGHCTMGFYFFAVGLVLARLGYRKWSYASYIFAIFLGFALGLTRMSQGGHYLSDVLMTGLIMWIVAIAFDWLIYSDEKGIA